MQRWSASAPPLPPSPSAIAARSGRDRSRGAGPGAAVSALIPFRSKSEVARLGLGTMEKPDGAKGYYSVQWFSSEPEWNRVYPGHPIEFRFRDTVIEAVADFVNQLHASPLARDVSARWVSE